MHALEGFGQKRGAFSGECNQDEDGKVSSLLCSIKEFDFIIALCVAEHVVNPVARTNAEGIVSLLIFMTFIMILAPLAASISSAFVKQLVLVAPRLSIAMLCDFYNFCSHSKCFKKVRKAGLTG